MQLFLVRCLFRNQITENNNNDAQCLLNIYTYALFIFRFLSASLTISSVNPFHCIISLMNSSTLCCPMSIILLEGPWRRTLLSLSLFSFFQLLLEVLHYSVFHILLFSMPKKQIYNNNPHTARLFIKFSKRGVHFFKYFYFFL